MKSIYKEKEYSSIELDLVDIRGYRNLEVINGRIISSTIEKDITNKYYVSVLVDEIIIFKIYRDRHTIKLEIYLDLRLRKIKN